MSSFFIKTGEQREVGLLSENRRGEGANLKTTTPVQGLLPKYTSGEGGQTVGNWLRKPHRLRGPEGLTDEKHKQRAMKRGGGSDGRGSRGEEERQRRGKGGQELEEEVGTRGGRKKGKRKTRRPHQEQYAPRE